MKANKFVTTIATIAFLNSSIPAVPLHVFASKLLQPGKHSLMQDAPQKKAAKPRQDGENKKQAEPAPFKNLKQTVAKAKLSNGDWAVITTTRAAANSWLVQNKNRFFNWKNTELLPCNPLPTIVVGQYWGVDEGRQSIYFGGWLNMPKKSLGEDFFSNNDLSAAEITSIKKISNGDVCSVYYLDRSGRNSVNVRSGSVSFGYWQGYASIIVKDPSFGTTGIALNDILYLEKN
ncbi:MAG: hypothetical protein WCT52_03430 [Candidatus Micrarchaeia archaeon]